MSEEKPTLADIIKKVKAGKKRKFEQSIDLIVNLKNIDMKKAENKVKTEVSLPHSLGKKTTIGFFADNLIPQFRGLEGVVMIRRDKIDSYKGNKKQIKKLAKKCHAFLAEAPLMPQIGKIFGQVLAVRGKMPRPVPPTLPNVKPLIERERNNYKIVLKDAPVVQMAVGAESMEDKKIIENVEKVLSTLRNSLPRGKEQLKEACLKLTMGKPEKISL